MRPHAMCVGVRSMCGLYEAGHWLVSIAQILNDWRVPLTLLKLSPPLSAVMKAHAVACGRLLGA